MWNTIDDRYSDLSRSEYVSNYSIRGKTNTAVHVATLLNRVKLWYLSAKVFPTVLVAGKYLATTYFVLSHKHRVSVPFLCSGPTSACQVLGCFYPHVKIKKYSCPILEKDV